MATKSSKKRKQREVDVVVTTPDSEAMPPIETISVPTTTAATQEAKKPFVKFIGGSACKVKHMYGRRMCGLWPNLAEVVQSLHRERTICAVEETKDSLVYVISDPVVRMEVLDKTVQGSINNPATIDDLNREIQLLQDQIKFYRGVGQERSLNLEVFRRIVAGVQNSVAEAIFGNGEESFRKLQMEVAEASDELEEMSSEAAEAEAIEMAIQKGISSKEAKSRADEVWATEDKPKKKFFEVIRKLKGVVRTGEVRPVRGNQLGRKLELVKNELKSA